MRRIRARLAYLLDRLPGLCWRELVGWAQFGDPFPWRGGTESCRDSAAEVGTCYCGKFARTDVAAGPDGPRCPIVVTAHDPSGTP